jgi:hypothetical protein
MNLFCSMAAVKLNLCKAVTPVTELKHQIRGQTKGPLGIWTKQVETLTLIAVNEISPLYSDVLLQLNQHQFGD